MIAVLCALFVVFATGCGRPQTNTPAPVPEPQPVVPETTEYVSPEAPPVDEEASASDEEDGGEIEWISDYDEGRRQAKADGKPALIDFGAAWCPPCQDMDREAWPDARIVELAEQFVCIKIDLDKDRTTPTKYGVRNVPTVLFLGPDGAEIDRRVGYRGGDAGVSDLADQMRKALGE